MPFIGPRGRQNQNAIPFGEFDGSQRADVGIGPYKTAQFRKSAPHYHPRRRVQSEALCAADGTENLLLGTKIVRNPSNRHTAESSKRVLRYLWARSTCTANLEPPEFQKGPQALLLSCAAAQPLPATSSWRLDTTLLCAAKKNGVEKWTVWQSSARTKMAPGPRAENTTLHSL